MNIRPLSVIAEPVTLAQAKLHLRLDDDGDSPAAHPDDAMIETLITAAREHAENFTGRSLGITNYLLRISGFESPIELPKAPLVNVVSIEYQNDAGVWTLVDDDLYYVDDDIEGAWVFLQPDEEWPTPGDYANPVRITFQAGYSDGDSPPGSTLPKPIYQAILLIVGHLYENREQTSERPVSEIPMGAMSLMRPYRVLLGMA